MEDEIGIYIHIPFCKSKCFYCDFCSYCDKDTYISKYIDAVINEILSYSEVLSLRNIKTVYIGGGTPSYIDSKYIVKVLDVLSIFFKEAGIEITIECNPNSITDEKIKDYISAKINRFSIGMQSTEDNILKAIGRVHNYSQFEQSLDILNKNGVNNISLDLIYPLPYLDMKTLKSSLKKVKVLSQKYPIKHISVYNLELHKGSKLDFLISEGFLTLPDEDEEYEMKQYIYSFLDENEYHKYEISNFAKSGYHSRHNLNYWKQKQYIGIGVNASSFLNGKRYTNTESLDDYIAYYVQQDYSKSVIKEQYEMSKLELMKEYIILGLRTSSGIDREEFKRKFKVDIYDVFKTELDSLTCDKLLLIKENNICLTERGSEVANIVWQQFV